MKCCICGNELSNLGNNANPIKDGRCCDTCNSRYVIFARLKELEKQHKLHEENNKNN